MVKPGVTTHEIDKAVYRFIKSQGAEPSFLNYSGYPASVCVSVNDEIIHGIPGPRVLREGDIVSVDVAPTSAASTATARPLYPAEKFPPRPSGSSTSHSRASSKASDSPARASAFRISLRRCRNTLRTMATASCANMSVTASAERCTRAPEVPNFGAPGHGPRLLRGMTIAVEPMVNAGGAQSGSCRTAGLSRPKTVRLPHTTKTRSSSPTAKRSF